MNDHRQEESRVPKAVVEFAQRLNRKDILFFNWHHSERAEQPWLVHPWLPVPDVDGDGLYFIQRMPIPSRIVMHFRTYSGALGTVVAEVTHIYRASDGNPRIDFQYPAGMNEFHGCPNFWSAFSRVLALVNTAVEPMFAPDEDSSVFIDIVKQYGRRFIAAECETCCKAAESYKEKPFYPKDGSVNDVTWRCPECGRDWWQSNTYFHLWQEVSPAEAHAAAWNAAMAPWIDMQ